VKVFAYGSNMCSGRLRAYKVKPLRVWRAYLPGWKLLFHKRSADGSGKADVVPARADARVWGVVYEISKADLRKLDDGERGYHRCRLTLSGPRGGSFRGWVYRADPDTCDCGLQPYEWYKRFLVEGAEEHSLPSDYITTLRAIAAKPDPDRPRDKKKRALSCRLD